MADKPRPAQTEYIKFVNIMETNCKMKQEISKAWERSLPKYFNHSPQKIKF